MGLRDRNKEEKLQRIERAGRALFAEHGFEATTTRAIAERAGIGVGTLFVYFPQKTDLMLHLYLGDMRRVEAEAFGSLDPQLGLVDGLMHLFESFYGYYARDPRLGRVFIKEAIFLEPGPRVQMAQETLGLVARLAGLVAAGKARGEVRRDVEELEAGYYFVGAYFFGLIAWLGEVTSLEQQLAMLRRSLTTIVAGLAPATGAATPPGPATGATLASPAATSAARARDQKRGGRRR